MEQGWVYVLVNSSIPGLVKVGRTTRPPADRAAELSAATGVATPFILAFEQEFADCAAAEAAIHAELDRRGLRVANNREFFRANPAEVVRITLELAASSGDGPKLRPPASVEQLLAEADAFLYGDGESMQDVGEAVRLYRLAATRGSLLATEQLGAICLNMRGNSRAGRRRALQFLKDGAKRGNYYCYVEMAQLFTEEQNRANFGKAWDLFFATRRTAKNDEAEHGENRYGTALRRYISQCFDLNLEPAHRDELRSGAESMIHALVTTLDQVRDAPELRQSLAYVLRWCYQNLLPDPLIMGLPTTTPRWIGSWLIRGRRHA